MASWCEGNRLLAFKRSVMPQLACEEFERLPLRVHAFLAGVPLHDVWAVDLPRARHGITLVEFLQRAAGLFLQLPPAVRAQMLGIYEMNERNMPVFGWYSKNTTCRASLKRTAI